MTLPIFLAHLVVCDGEHGRGEDDGEEPGHEAHQPRLVLGPDEPRPQWHAHRVVPAQLTAHGGQRPVGIWCHLSTVMARMVRTEVWDTVSSMKGTSRHMDLPITQMS